MRCKLARIMADLSSREAGNKEQTADLSQKAALLMWTCERERGMRKVSSERAPVIISPLRLVSSHLSWWWVRFVECSWMLRRHNHKKHDLFSDFIERLWRCCWLHCITARQHRRALRQEMSPLFCFDSVIISTQQKGVQEKKSITPFNYKWDD